MSDDLSRCVVERLIPPRAKWPLLDLSQTRFEPGFWSGNLVKDLLKAGAVDVAHLVDDYMLSSYGLVERRRVAGRLPHELAEQGVWKILSDYWKKRSPWHAKDPLFDYRKAQERRAVFSAALMEELHEDMERFEGLEP